MRGFSPGIQKILQLVFPPLVVYPAFASTQIPPSHPRIMLVKELKIASSTDPSVVYTIRVERDPPRVSCDCIGCQTHGYCKHMKFYRKLIKRLLK